MIKKLFTLVLSLPFLVGFTFTPMSQSIRLDQKQKHAQFIVENPSDEPMAIEITLKERHQKEDGKEDTPATKELSAFPPQLIVPPKERRTVRISWLGTPPKDELAFRVIAEQLPLEVNGEKKKGSGIKMLLKYVAALYVDPGKTKHNLIVTKIEPGTELKVTIKNSGNAHAPLLSPVLTLKKNDEKIVLKDALLKGLAGENILAGSQRVFTIPAIKGVDASYEGSIEIE
jgi:fimbrial chaperone protein